MATLSPHPNLQLLKSHLQQIHDSISYFQPLIARPPILDSAFDTANEDSEENHWLKQENIPGLKKLKENIKIDLGFLDKFFDDPDCANLPPLSTNAPYLIAVWNEVLCAPPPIVSVFKTFSINASASASEFDGSRKKGTQHSAGTKVDVIADNGRRWLRVNTAKNSRLLSEFREIDSYLTDSEYESDEDLSHPNVLDNSVLRMGKSLLDAAKANPIEGTAETPKVTLRLTRLNPNLLNEDGTAPDARIAQTLDSLREMGIDVELGERTGSELPIITIPTLTDQAPSPSLPFVPTLNINLDLSILIALISDLTHAALPASVEEANKRFLPPQEYREWKKQKKVENPPKPRKSKPRPTSSRDSSFVEADINDLPHDLIKHSRALTNQLLQEMGKGLLQEMYNRISALNTQEDDSAKLKVTFWTTPEARDRCLRIVSKIGGVHEKRRAHTLFCYDTAGGGVEIPLDEAKRLYWQGSRFGPNFIPLLPIHMFPTSSVLTLGQDTSTEIPNLSSSSPTPRSDLSSFTKSLNKVCADILSQETIAHPRALPDEVVGPSGTPITPSSPTHFESVLGEIQRATVTKANPRLTIHTIQSMHWGAHLGWTTLTANRSSVKAILREMKTARMSGKLAGFDLQFDHPSGQNLVHIPHEDLAGYGDEVVEGGAGWAAIWIVDPRSLAEGMSS